MTEDKHRSVGEIAKELLAEHYGYDPSSDRIEGCSEEELRELEEQHDIELPKAYKSFMRHLGKGAGNFWMGSDWTYPKVNNLKEYAEKSLEMFDVDFEFEENDFVFYGLQGHTYRFFNTENGDDPPVYKYRENRDQAEKLEDSFSEFIFEVIKET
jgi:hypothetical protein